MKKCDYCGRRADDFEKLCSSCGAELPFVEQKVNYNFTYSKELEKKRSEENKKIILIATVIIVVFIVSPIIIFTTLIFSSKKNNYDKKKSYITNTSPTEKILEQEIEFDDSFKQALELVFNKSFMEITNYDLLKINYLSIGDKEVAFGFEIPEIIDGKILNENIFNEKISTVKTDDAISNLDFLSKLSNLHYLNINSGSFDANKISNIGSLKILHCNTYTNNENLKAFTKFENLESLVVSGSSITNLEGITELKKLKRIGLQNTNISNLSLIANLDNIISVSLKSNSSLASLNTLTNKGNLKELTVESFDFYDLNIIGTLKSLEYLKIKDTKSKNLDFVNTLTNLKFLSLINNSELLFLPDLSPLTSIEELEISCDYFENDNIDFLNNLPSVEKFTFIGAPNLVPLSNMPNLEELYLEFGWRIESTKELSEPKSLKKLTMTNCGNYYNISDISGISKLPNLEYLNLNKMEIYFEVEPIFSIPNLKYLSLTDNTIVGSLENIKNLSKLEELYVNGLSIVSAVRYETDGFVTSTYTSDEIPIQNFSDALSKLKMLKVLDVSNNNLKDIEFVKNFVNLEKFYASDNYFTDISSLAELKNLKLVDLSKNAISNWEVLKNNINLKIIGK